MLRKRLLLSQNRFHKIYQERIASADGRQEAMEKDLADFDKGIELLLQGQRYEVCRKIMPRFLTVYSWILQGNLPLSFRDYNTTTSFKKINRNLLSESPSFAYLVGVYQAKTKVIHPQTLTIGTGDSSLECEVEKCFNALHMKPAKKKIVYKKNRSNQRIYYCSSGLMSYISEITENNSRIPHLFFIPNLMNAYLAGFCDANSSPTYYKSKPECSSIIRKYPTILVAKKGNVPLLSAINSALNVLGIASVYDPQKDSKRIRITAIKSIKKFIDLGLYRSYKKMGRLKELYDYWKDTKELDDHGAYQKLKYEIRMQRDENKPGAHIEKEDEPEEIEFDEAEPTDEDILKEDN